MTDLIRAAAERLLQQLDQRRASPDSPLLLERAEDDLRTALAAHPAVERAMSDPARAELAALVAAHDEHGGNWLPVHEEAWHNALKRARAVLAAPTPSAGGGVMTDPARAVLQRLVDAFKVPGQSLPVEEWIALAEGALATSTPPADGEAKIHPEVRAAFAELERCEENLRSFRQLSAALAAPTPEPAADAVLKLAAIIREVDGSHRLGAAALAEAILSHPTAGYVFATPTPPADGEVGELAAWLEDHAEHCTELGRPDWVQCSRRAAALLRQLPPEGLEVVEYLHADSGAYVVHEPRDGRCRIRCWTVRNHRHVNPFTFFPTLAAAWEALQKARRKEESDD